MAAAAVAEFTRGFAADEASACMSEYLGEFENNQVEITGAELGELSFTPPVGVDDASAWQVVFSVEGKPGTDAAGVSADAYVDFVQLREGAATAA
jgi:hypothetical protein